MVDIDALAGAGSDRRQSRGNRDMRVGIAADHGAFSSKEGGCWAGSAGLARRWDSKVGLSRACRQAI